MSFIIRILTSLCGSLSVAQVQKWGKRLGFLLGSVLRYRRAEVLCTIQRCLTEKSPAEVRAIADGMYRNLGTLIIESMRFEKFDSEYLAQNIEFDRMEIVYDALKQGKGVIVLTAHIGNFDLMVIIAALLGTALTIITKKIKPRALNDYWNRVRTQFGAKMVPHHGSFRACLSALKRNEVLGFVLDQNMKRDMGIFVDFFGRPACTSPGLAMLSARSGAPVVPIFITRKPDGRHHVGVMDALPPPAGRGRDEEEIRRETQRYTKIIEETVRKHPEQWIWLHRRWRTQPLNPDIA